MFEKRNYRKSYDQFALKLSVVGLFIQNVLVYQVDFKLKTDKK